MGEITYQAKRYPSPSSSEALLFILCHINHLNQRTRFVVRRVPSATLGKNGDDGLY